MNVPRAGYLHGGDLTRLSSELGEGIRRAVEILLRARLPVLAPTWQRESAPVVYSAACRFVMRLVVILFAEARELLPFDHGLGELFDRLGRLSAEQRREHTSAWSLLLARFKRIHEAHGGDLFKPGELAGGGVQTALARIESPDHPPSDDTIYRLLERITHTHQRSTPAPVDFTALTSEYIGIFYEGLLDYELHRAGAHPVLLLNLGDQPALPLDQLERMHDHALAALIEKARVTRDPVTDHAEIEDDADDTSETEDRIPHSDLAVEPPESRDPLADARRRALAWTRRAVVAGKLVQKPAGRNADRHLEYRAEIERAAVQLIADIKPPGELYLVRWGGTRKGAGTFYTRPQLAQPTVRRTLDPLTHDADGRVRPPEVLLDLKLCDPAMGSGSFLIAALRVLTDRVVHALRVHDRLRVYNDCIQLACDHLPDTDHDLPTENIDARLVAVVRRAVVQRCLYGVDIDPLATELARVALWIETLDRQLPFTFLDHKLRCGDALIGAWLDRVRDYPLLAWWRQSPDEHWRGVTHTGDTWARALKDRRKVVLAQLARQLSRTEPAADSDDSIEPALNDVRALFQRHRDIPASLSHHRATDPALARVRDACDLWCALWFWPLDRLDDAPTPDTFAAPSDVARAISRELRQTRRFFHWELEFPDVFQHPGAGFDAIVGNPPWEIRKPSSKEFFSELDPLYRTHSKQDALLRQRELFAADPKLERRWLDHIGRLKDASNFVRHAAEPFGDVEDAEGRPQLLLVPRKLDHSRRLHHQWAAQRELRTSYADPAHPFRDQGSADLNSYKLFVEQAHALLRPGGQLGLITPSGIYTDKGSADLRRLLLDRCQWRWLYGFENRNKLFDIDGRFKFAVTIAEKGGQTATLQAAFMRHALEDWSEARGALAYPAERIHAFSPRSLTVLEIRSERDLEVLTKIYADSVLLGDTGPNGWGLHYATEFHMTGDSTRFIPRDKAEAAGYKPDAYGRWLDPGGDVLLPLYEGRMIGQFDFSQKGWVRGKGRAAIWRDIPWDQKSLEPQFLVRQTDARSPDSKALCGPKIAYMRIGSATNTRTVISTYLRDTPAGDSVFYFVPQPPSVQTALAIVGIFNTFAYDFAVRARLGGLNLSEFLMVETPLISPRNFLATPLIPHILRLACGTPWFAPEWLSVAPRSARCELSGIGAHERLRLRCLLDAVVAALYGLSRADLRWILRDCDHPKQRLADIAFCRTLDPKGFWRVDRDHDPELRHTVLTLVAFDALDGLITDHRDRHAGIRAFCALRGGEGWPLPETLRLADHDLGHDMRARAPQPVAGRLGPRVLDRQLAQPPEESWAECERHARAILGNDEFERRFARPADPPPCPRPSAAPITES